MNNTPLISPALISHTVVLDGSALFRIGLSQVIARQLPAATIHSLESFQDLKELFSRQPDLPQRVGLLAVGMALRDCLSLGCMNELSRFIAPARWIVFLDFQDQPMISRLLELGVLHIHRRFDSVEQLQRSLNYIATAPSPRLLRPSCESNARESLTPREKTVYHLLLQGYSNKEIARILTLAPGTVRNRIGLILGKYGVQNSRQLIARSSASEAAALAQ